MRPMLGPPESTMPPRQTRVDREVDAVVHLRRAAVVRRQRDDVVLRGEEVRIEKPVTV